MRLLIAEDELSLARAISKILEKNNYSTDIVGNGDDALIYIESGYYDAVILDIMMPKTNGLTVLRTIRAKGNQIPVLLLTAKSEIDDKVVGLDSGANYYLTKPFDTKELLACIRTITRSSNAADSVLKIGNISLNRATFELSTEHGSFRLTNKEFQMLEMLMLNTGTLISSERFMGKIWGYNSDTEINVVWVYVSYLRKKLSALQANIKIKSHRNSGYYLEVEKV